MRCNRCKKDVEKGDDCQERVCDHERLYDGGDLTITKLVITDDQEQTYGQFTHGR